MLIPFALALIIAVFACVFALQNAHTTAITFLTLKYEASLALVLLATFALGAIVSLLASLPTLIKGKLEMSRLKAKIKELEGAPSPEAPAPSPPKTPPSSSPSGA